MIPYNQPVNIAISLTLGQERRALLLPPGNIDFSAIRIWIVPSSYLRTPIISPLGPGRRTRRTSRKPASRNQLAYSGSL